MMKRREGYFRGKNDFELFFQVWEPPKPDATLVITHGLGEHTESYQRLVDGVSALNIRCVAWDLRGHGRSEGKRGVIDSFSDFSDDLEIFLHFLQKEFNSEKIALMGHSMGGLINLNAIIDHGNMGLKCLCLSSPFLGVQVQVPKIKGMAAEYISKYLPSLTMWNEIKDTTLTHDKKVLEGYKKDNLRHDRISARLFLESVGCIEKVRTQGSKIALPLIMQMAGHDLVVSAEASKQFFETIASKNKTLKIYEDYYHEIFNEVGRENVFKDLREWLKANLIG